MGSIDVALSWRDIVVLDDCYRVVLESNIMVRAE